MVVARIEGECWELMGVLCGVILAVTGALVKVCKLAWDTHLARLKDHQDFEAQTNALMSHLKHKKGVSP